MTTTYLPNATSGSSVITTSLLAANSFLQFFSLNVDPSLLGWYATITVTSNLTDPNTIYPVTFSNSDPFPTQVTIPEINGYYYEIKNPRIYFGVAYSSNESFALLQLRVSFRAQSTTYNRVLLNQLTSYSSVPYPEYYGRLPQNITQASIVTYSVHSNFVWIPYQSTFSLNFCMGLCRTEYCYVQYCNISFPISLLNPNNQSIWTLQVYPPDPYLSYNISWRLNEMQELSNQSFLGTVSTSIV